MVHFCCGHLSCKDGCPHLFETLRSRNQHEIKVQAYCNSPLCSVCFMLNHKEELSKLIGKHTKNEDREVFIDIFDKIIDQTRECSTLKKDLKQMRERVDELERVIERTKEEKTNSGKASSLESNSHKSLQPYQRKTRSISLQPTFRFGLQDSSLFTSTISKLHCSCGAQMSVKKWNFSGGCFGAELSCISDSCNKKIIHEGSKKMDGMKRRKELPYRLQTAFVSTFGSCYKKFSLFFTLAGMQCPCDKDSFYKFNSEYIRPH